MHNVKAESRKKWVAPELKKIDIEQITAYGGNTHNVDAGHRS